MKCNRLPFYQAIIQGFPFHAFLWYTTLKVAVKEIGTSRREFQHELSLSRLVTLVGR